jgi:PhoH-like ATPase
MKKVFVLDTNVLLHDPKAIFSFADNDVVIPIVVIEELDKFKKGIDEIGRNARQVSRILDEYRQKGKLSQGVPLEKGGMLRVELNHQSPEYLPNELIATKADNRILATALNLRHDDLPVILVTKDTNLRIKADAVGLHAEDFESETIMIDELYSGEVELAVDPGAIEDFYANGELASKDPKPFPNQFVLLKNNANPSQTALARYSQQKMGLVPIANTKHGIWGVTARNKQQQYALDLLLNDDIRLVTLVGKAGTGKTLLALAAGLEKTIESRSFLRLVVSRVPHGQGHRLSAWRHRREAQALDAADQGQPRFSGRVFRRPGKGQREKGPAEPVRPGDDRGGTAHVYPRPQHAQPIPDRGRSTKPDPP